MMGLGGEKKLRQKNGGDNGPTLAGGKPSTICGKGIWPCCNTPFGAKNPPNEMKITEF